MCVYVYDSIFIQLVAVGGGDDDDGGAAAAVAVVVVIDVAANSNETVQMHRYCLNGIKCIQQQ